MKIGRIWRPGFFDQIIGKYQETRLGRQELSVAAAMEVLSRSPGFNNDNRSSTAIWSGPIETVVNRHPCLSPIAIRLTSMSGLFPCVLDIFRHGVTRLPQSMYCTQTILSPSPPCASRVRSLLGHSVAGADRWDTGARAFRR